MTNGVTAEQKLTMSNDLSIPMRLVVEPWAEEWLIQPNQTLVLIAQSPEGKGHFDVRFVAGATVVSAWHGATIKVWRDELEQTSASAVIPAL